MGIKSTNRRPPPPPKFLFQFRNCSSIRLAGLAGKLFRNCMFQFGGVRPVGEELSCRLPGATKVLWSTTKMRAKPEYGAIFWYIVVHQQGIIWRPQPREFHLQKQPNLLPPIWHSSQCPTHLLRKYCLFRCFHPNLDKKVF